MKNLFSRLGESIEKDKLDKKRVLSKYWKLNPIERIDYDNKIRDIKDANNYPGFFLTLFSMKITIFTTIILMFYMIIFKDLNFITLLREFYMGFLEVIILAVILGLFFIIYSPFLTSIEVRELNKKFNLR